MPATIVIRQRTSDFAKWKRVFDDNRELRINGGCLSSVVYRDPADPGVVVVMNHMKDVDSARKYVRAPALVDAMFKARVVEAPEILVLEQVDEQTYVDDDGGA